MMPLRLVAMLVLMATLVTTTGCAKLGLGREPRPRAKVTGMSVGSWQARSMTLNARVELHNPYPAPLPLTNIEYKLQVLDDRHEVATGTVETPYLVPPLGKSTFAVPIEIDFAETLRTVRGLRLGMVVPYRVEVDLLVTPPGTGSLRIPVNHRGQFVLPAPPVMFVQQVRVGSSTLADTRMGALLSITNTNEFPATLGAFSYRFGLQGMELTAGFAEGPLVLEPGQTGTLPVEFSVSAQQTGHALWSVLRGNDVEYDLFAEFVLETPHGSIRQRVDRSGTANLIPWRE